MRIVVDTNVVVSGTMASARPPGLVIRAILRRDVTLLLDERIAAEYVEVMARPSLPGSTERRLSFARDLLAVAVRVTATTQLDGLPDADDAPFLAVALDAAADHLVTGNLRHFPAACRRGVSVLTPRELIDAYPQVFTLAG